MMWVWLIISVLICALGEYTAKQWSLDPSWKLAIMATVYYAAGSAAWFPVVKEKNQLIVAWMLWAILASISTVLIGVHFGETLTPTQWVGTILGVIAIILIAI